jgi:hypothetical protein
MEPSIKDDEIIEEIIATPMGDDTIRHYFPNCPIIKYSELANCQNIYNILKKNLSFCFILYEESPNSGHWVVISRYGKVIEYFDSYGGPVDGPIIEKWSSNEENEELGQGKKYLTELLRASGAIIKHNKIDYQRESPQISTCGRWCCLRIKALQRGLDLKAFRNLISQLRAASKLTNDQIVAELIDEI